MIFPWKNLAGIALGVMVGLGALVFRTSEAPSYLSDRPETCVNCHIMRSQYATWKSSSHHAVTHCNDCHVPQDNVVRKYLFKSMDGFRHSAMFTLHLEPQVIRIHEAGSKVVQENCVRCHGQIVDGTAMGKLSFTTQQNDRPSTAMAFGSMETKARPMPVSHKDGRRKCVECHRTVPHGRVESLSSAPDVRIRRLDAIGSTSDKKQLGSILLEKKP